ESHLCYNAGKRLHRPTRGMRPPPPRLFGCRLNRRLRIALDGPEAAGYHAEPDRNSREASMKRTAWLAVALVVAGLQAGCVTRRVMIPSEPPGAVVYRNGQPIGATPLEEPFVYHGHYHYRFVKDGYQPQDVYPDLVPPWYEWPGVDFVTENLVPYTFRDVQ